MWCTRKLSYDSVMGVQVVLLNDRLTSFECHNSYVNNVTVSFLHFACRDLKTSK